MPPNSALSRAETRPSPATLRRNAHCRDRFKENLIKVPFTDPILAGWFAGEPGVMYVCVYACASVAGGGRG